MIIVNMDKAKTIGHQMRRAQREAEFAPFDAVIAKQIPGVDNAAAEASRQAIRDKYVVIQGVIDAATTPEEIKAALAPPVPIVEEPTFEGFPMPEGDV